MRRKQARQAFLTPTRRGVVDATTAYRFVNWFLAPCFVIILIVAMAWPVFWRYMRIYHPDLFWYAFNHVPYLLRDILF